jgi:tetratricopeptide (TPR) repeat protein
MSAVIPENETKTEVTTSDAIAPKTILKSTYVSVIKALRDGSMLILITGNQDKGKSALVHTINKDISKINRTIFLSGKDLPSLDKSKDNDNVELENMKDFILESTDLEDKLVVILDDAHCLPISFLGKLVSAIKKVDQQTNTLQIVLSGPLNFKDQLLAIEQINAEDLTHFPIDSLSNDAILTYIKSKKYKISSNIKQLDFDSTSLAEISDFIQSDQQRLDVILEWCAAIVKKDQLNRISSKIVSQAAHFAQQFSRDKNLPLSNAYPPSHEVYKYINDIQRSNKPDKKSVKNVPKISVKKVTTKKSTTQKTKNPTTSEKIQLKAENEQQRGPNKNIEKENKKDEIASSNRIPKTIPEHNNKKFLFAASGIAAIAIISFITFTSFQAEPDSKQENQSELVVADPNSGSEEQNKPNPVKQKLTIETTAKLDKVVPTTPANNKELPIDTKPTDIKVETNEQTTAKNNLEINTSDLSKTISGIDPSLESSKTVQKTDLLTDKDINNDIKSKINNAKTTEKKSEVIALKNKDKPNEKSGQTEQSTEKIDEPRLNTELSDLLILAKFQFDSKQLSTPSGDNALETYQKILAKYPNNKEAIAGIQNVHYKYLGWGNHYLKTNELDRAKNFYNKALGIDPSNTVAINKLQTIAQLQANDNTNNVGEEIQNSSQANYQPNENQNLLATAKEKMQQINSEIGANNRNYKTYQEVQTIYQQILRSSPQNQEALSGLRTIKKHYADWAELQVQSKNYNIALFLYGQALSLEPQNPIINQRIEQIRAYKKAL